jgi:hypothetical protein
MTEEQVATYARDAAALTRSQELAQAWKWQNMAANERVIWAELRGSGFPPFRTQVDLNQTAFKCTCPSRIFPCKHGVGLLLLYVRTGDAFEKNQPEPDWVSEWITKRHKKVSPTDKTTTTNTAAQQKRQDARLLAVQNGLADTELLLRDWVRTGLMQLPDKDAAFFQHIAARLVDAKASGIAFRVRQLEQIVRQQAEHWQAEALAAISEIWLICRAFRQLDTLSEPVKEEIKTQIGWTQTQNALLEDSQRIQIYDRWLCIGLETSQEENLTLICYWMYGLYSGKTALIRQYFHSSQSLEWSYRPGQIQEGAVVYYPGAIAQRAVFNPQAEKNSDWMHQEPASPYPDWATSQKIWAAQIAASLWQKEMLIYIANVYLAQEREQWYVVDNTGIAMLIVPEFEAHKRVQILAISGGKPLAMMILRREKMVCPLGVWHESDYLPC